MIQPTGIEAKVCADISSRQQLGIGKYGVTVEQSTDDMLQHAYEEALDLAVYLKAEIETKQRLLSLLKRARHFSNGMDMAAYEAIQESINLLER